MAGGAATSIRQPLNTQGPALTYTVFVGDGRVVLPCATCEQYLAGVLSAALIERDGQVFLVPLSGPSAGGMLLKRRNALGDHVLLATDFLDDRGLGRFSTGLNFPVRWVEDAGALLIEGLGSAVA